MPSRVELRLSSEGAWLTPNNRRVFVAAAVESEAGGRWTFSVKPKSYEVLVLLCWSQADRLRDFVLPQKLFVTPWAAAKKLAGKGDLVFSIVHDGDSFQMHLPLADPVSLSGTEANYEPMV